MSEQQTENFCGREVNEATLAEIREIVASCSGLSRTELANTVCELWEWKRPRGQLKTVECRQFLEELDRRGLIELPAGRKGRPRGLKTRVLRTGWGEPQGIITGAIRDHQPITLNRVRSKGERDQWYEWIDRYHYLGYQVPFGAQLRYFIENREGRRLGCFQFSSPAWKMAPRTGGSAGMRPSGKRIFKRSLITAGF